jgi:ABC-type transport system involved in cytochrome c biogenesis permease subunit
MTPNQPDVPMAQPASPITVPSTAPSAAAPEAATGANSPPKAAKKVSASVITWASFAVAVGLSAMALLPPSQPRGFDVERFGRLPALEGGRVKPIDSLARNSLLLIRGQQSFRDGGRTIGANEWLLEVMFRPEVADAQPVFVINDPDVLGLLGLKQTSDRYFTFRTLQPHLDKIQSQADVAHGIEAKQRTRFQSAIANLYERIFVYYRLQNTSQIQRGPTLAQELAMRGQPSARERYQGISQLAHFRPLPPLPGTAPDAFHNVGEALAAPALDPALAPFAKIGAAWTAQDANGFHSALAELEALSVTSPGAKDAASSELVFNRAAPFYLGMVVYVATLLLLFGSWIWRPDLLQPASYGFLLAGAFVHTAGLAARVILQGRPPVTNLYSSAVFVGWGAVLLGVVLEALYRRGFGTAVAAASGFASLIVAHHLAADGDTMEMMRAVLDSNFWLATHVVTVTIGYSATFLAGAVAIGYALHKHLAPKPDPETVKVLGAMTYGIVCFGLLFSFVGTVLGGIWADQSWGRFWGWDPKENGALLIVLWNAIILHARWGGYARERGIMAMAIFGNVITSLSWFGVNMLGVGLHSYGFMDKAFWALAGFCGSQLVLIAVCLAPRSLFRRDAPKTTVREPPSQGAALQT